MVVHHHHNVHVTRRYTARCTIEYRTTIASGFYRRKVDFYTKPRQKYHTGHKVRISYSMTFISHLRLWVSGRKQTTTMLNNFKRNYDFFILLLHHASEHHGGEMRSYYKYLLASLHYSIDISSLKESHSCS